jgi:ParB/RepB/Spo0J family partition protein
MVKKRMSIRELGDRARGEESTTETPVKERASRAGAQVVHSNTRASQFHTPQSMMLPLPVSKREIKMDLIELDPTQSFASPINPRNQTLLSLDDPEVQNLERSIRTDQQRDPVLARRIKIDGEVRYEVIAGTTRRFVCEHLNQIVEGGFKLRAWVGDIPDGDRRAIAISENRDRRDLSAWEEAIDAARYCAMDDNHYKTQDVLASELGMTRPKLNKLLQIAKIPQYVIESLTSPQLLTQNAGAALASKVGQLTSKQSEALKTFVAASKYDNLLNLQKAIQTEIEKPKKKAPVFASKPYVVRDEQGVRAKITRHRTQKDQFKVDLFGLSEQDESWLVGILEERFSGESSR